MDNQSLNWKQRLPALSSPTPHLTVATARWANHPVSHSQSQNMNLRLLNLSSAQESKYSVFLLICPMRVIFFLSSQKQNRAKPSNNFIPNSSNLQKLHVACFLFENHPNGLSLVYNIGKISIGFLRGLGRLLLQSARQYSSKKLPSFKSELNEGLEKNWKHT